ncbi:pilin [Undibacterium sp.]|jgi:type IV pilus assembly protein PilA|uniref:pilin n=1 Tax=Undibacterium sp. TaxID=1914977 RepID=UPI002B7E1554|nr:pilin [Undibacterium sp.]HTD05028.1 pilin [Undibacterium sp.]
MMKKNSGFTLLEMMVVVAVIAILALMALPSYQFKIVREQIEAGMSLADIAKKPIAAAWAAKQAFPADNAAADLPSADKIVNNYVSAVSIQDGVINITFGNRAHSSISGKVLTIRPAIVEGAPVVPVTWVCGNADAPNKMTVKGSNQSSVPVGYMPLPCRKITPKAG